MTLVIRYSIFAVFATFTNILVQDNVIQLYEGPHSVFLSVFVGTIVGLIVKYILDKKYIFRFRAKGISHDMQIFILYTLMGVLTTAVFWGAEFSFNFIFQNKGMRYLGGIIGLAIGYIMKYHLDKKFVFDKSD